MKNISAIFFNILLITLSLTSLVILYTENTSSFDDKIVSNIEAQLDDTLNVKSKIDSVSIIWSGTKPTIALKGLSLSNNKDQILLKTPLSELEIDIYSSLIVGKVSIAKITIHDTSINLIQDKSKISFNNLNLFERSTGSNKTNVPLVIINNSTLKLININTKNTESFKVDNFIASLKNNTVKINTRFLHNSSTEPITLILNSKLSDKGIKSKIFLSANSIKLPYNILPDSIRQLDTERMSVRIWVSMIKTSIKKVVGNISSKNIRLNLNQESLKIKNLNSDLLYVNDDRSNTLSLMRMNYENKNNKITNNKIIIQKNNNDDVKIFIKKTDSEFLRLITKVTQSNNINSVNKFINADINNLHVHLTKSNSINYFSLSIKKLNLKYKEYSAKNIDANIYGTLNAGTINIKNSDVIGKNFTINELSGVISYNSRGKSVYFSSSNIQNKQGHNIVVSGNKVSALPVIKIKISTTLKKIIKSTNFKKSNYEYDAKVISNIYFLNGNLFTASKINDFYLNISDSTYLSSKEFEIFSSSNMVSSKKFNFNLNGYNQYSKINTNINSNSYRYILTSIGNIESLTLQNLFNTNKKIISGKSRFKSIFTYDNFTNHVSIYSSSDLEGISIKTIKPWAKEENKKVDFVLNYQHFPKKSYPLKINLDKNEFEFKYSENDVYIKIKSPAARGILKYPYNNPEYNMFSGSFEYIDMTYFSSDRLIDYFPTINIQSKHVKTASTVFDNVHLIMTPKNDYIEISKLDFKNLNLEMYSKGKWYLDGKQRTEMTADIKSDNFGKALRGIGYPNTIKGGKMKAYVNSKWEGSLEDRKSVV